MAYTKLDANITTSSLWLEGDDVLRVWVYLLATADPDGCVFDTAPAIALRCGKELPRTRQILAILAAPDRDSRTPAAGGARLQIDTDPEWCITLVNHSKYRIKDHTNAARQKRFRERKARQSNALRNSSNALLSLPVTQAEAEAEVRSTAPVGAQCVVDPVSVVEAVVGTAGAEIGSTGGACSAPGVVDGGPPAFFDTPAEVVDVPGLGCGSRMDDRQCAQAAGHEGDHGDGNGNAWRTIGRIVEAAPEPAPAALEGGAYVEPPDPPPNAEAVARIVAERKARRAEVLEVFGYWQTVMGHPAAKLTDERAAKINTRLGEGYTVERIKAAVDGCRSSPHHRGENDSGTVYDDLTLILRTGSKLEYFEGMAGQGGKGKPVPMPARKSGGALRGEELDAHNTAVLNSMLGRSRGRE